MSLNDSLIELLQALRNGDHCARDDFASMLYPDLSERLRARYQFVDWEMCDTASIDAVMAILDQPELFDPLHGTFEAFIWGFAKRKLLDLITQEKRSRARSKSPKSAKNFSELDRRETEYIWSEKDDPAREIERRDRMVQLSKRIAEIRESMTKEEQETLDLMLQGVREIDAYRVFVRILCAPCAHL